MSQLEALRVSSAENGPRVAVKNGAHGAAFGCDSFTPFACTFSEGKWRGKADVFSLQHDDAIFFGGVIPCGCRPFSHSRGHVSRGT